MANRKTKASDADKLQASTTAFLESLNDGPLTFGQLLEAIRMADEQSLSQFSGRLGISRQHLIGSSPGPSEPAPNAPCASQRLWGTASFISCSWLYRTWSTRQASPQRSRSKSRSIRRRASRWNVRATRHTSAGAEREPDVADNTPLFGSRASWTAEVIRESVRPVSFT